MWGIAPAEPGYAKAVIRPQLGNLDYSRIKVPAIRGPIEADYNNDGKSKQYKISLPGNMKCDSITPAGKKIELEPGLNKLFVE